MFGWFTSRREAARVEAAPVWVSAPTENVADAADVDGLAPPTAPTPPDAAADSASATSPSKPPLAPPISRISPVQLRPDVPLAAHVRALAALLQADLRGEYVYSGPDVIMGYQELCADEGWLQHPWEHVASGLRKHLGIPKRYGTRAGRRYVIYRVPPPSTDPPASLAA